MDQSQWVFEDNATEIVEKMEDVEKLTAEVKVPVEKLLPKRP
jgi:hypothetical protein